jgi:cell division initiation protein
MSDLSPKRIREATVPTAFRGFDRAATRDLLDRIAEGYERLLAERDSLRDELAAAGTRTGPMSEDEEVAAMTETLLLAKRTATDVVTEAQKRAEAIAESAAEERRRILDSADSDVAERTLAARLDLETLIRERDSLRESISRSRAMFAEMLASVLETFDAMEDSEVGTNLDEALQTRLANDNASD